MKMTAAGKPMAEIRDPGGDGPVLYVDPSLYSVVRTAVEKKLACTVELNFNAGNLGRTHVRMDGQALSQALNSGNVTTVTLQSVPVS